ncbi:hypothetical protein CEXT_181711 [Caerostris extrusa]|uniref:Uncharacterized protein n=1 Tax=Caerostris extrusa TaxID=172846 RepID=A0AAV4X5E8_CAEEX|nr:hypothetical protein CEXT_181711 [Caerostris extrusa]
MVVHISEKSHKCSGQRSTLKRHLRTRTKECCVKELKQLIRLSPVFPVSPKRCFVDGLHSASESQLPIESEQLLSCWCVA